LLHAGRLFAQSSMMLLPNKSLKLRSRLQRFFVEIDGVVETVQASNNLTATLQFISS
jgi:hypothetical protein